MSKTSIQKRWSRLKVYALGGYSEEVYQKQLIWLGHLFFLLYLGLCALLWRERMLHFDTANYSYHLLLSEDFFAGMNRWIGVLPQVVPLFLIKLQAPLWLVLFSYSVSLGFIYYLAYLLIIYGFKSPGLGLFLCLSLCLCLRYKFYGPVGEIILSIPFIALLIAAIYPFIQQEKQQKLKVSAVVIVVLLSLLLVFAAHPFAIVSTLTAIGLMIIYHHAWRNTYIWICLAILALGSAWKYLEIQNRIYETQRLGQVQEWWDHWGNLSDFYAFDRFLWYFDTEYHLALCSFILVILALLKRKKWLTSLYVIFASLGISFLVISLHSYLKGPIYIMLDGYLAHLGLLWALAIAIVLLPSPQRIKIWFLAGILLFSLHRIWAKRSFFQERESYFLSIIERYPDHPKLVAHESQFDWDRYWLHWASGAETLLMTASKDKKKTATLHFLFARDSLNAVEKLDKKLLLHHFLDENRQAARELPEVYFELPKTSYYIIDVSQ